MMIPYKHNLAAETASWDQVADAAQSERLLNAYLRETAVSNPAAVPGDGLLSELPSALKDALKEGGRPLLLRLPATGVVIAGTLAYISSIGHHKYGTGLWIRRGSDAREEQRGFREMSGSLDLAQVLLGEIAASEARPERAEEAALMGAKMLEQIRGSLARTECYLRCNGAKHHATLEQQRGVGLVRAAEQALLLGHPFHPSPKSSQGFTHRDSELYSPELGAEFQLHYFSADPSIVEERTVGFVEESGLFSSTVIEEASRRLGEEYHHYILLPCHPWQAEYVKRLGEVSSLLASRRLIELGPLGEKLFPTSSVRTVWGEDAPAIYKLPLNVRITNFVRVNPTIQLRRALDASRIVTRALAAGMPYPDLVVIPERSYRTLATGDEGLASSFGVLFRHNPLCEQQGGRYDEAAAPLVVAALLEKRSDAVDAPLWGMIKLAATARSMPLNEAFITSWLERYVGISLIPLLWLFLEHGISLEAHVQNSLLALEQGWPRTLAVRDLEGASISRSRAHLYLSEQLVEDDSPALYADEEAWMRFKYYIIVNHFGHVIHTVGYHSRRSEKELWHVVRECIASSQLFLNPAYRPWLLDLLTGETLPVKANFISCYRQRGENPLYIDLPNPLNMASYEDRLVDWRR
ncbi:hypothetical protein K0T92_01200 [Paenibacillus oenotherae]|uniref:Siderophore synthetase component n=1 Tax=Paenibacillus oenotherae TaxID=1435645 RepID=A0ABS7D0I3_9BACL|nr:IucA/IucC family protein [Paenibacillus oenotherae]MBW7473356.1 hypothetical protein [Paenibacillus oenotherae]